MLNLPSPVDTILIYTMSKSLVLNPVPPTLTNMAQVTLSIMIYSSLRNRSSKLSPVIFILKSVTLRMNQSNTLEAAMTGLGRILVATGVLVDDEANCDKRGR